MRTIYNLVADYAQTFGIHINAKKSGYGWVNDTEPPQLKYNNQNIEMLGHAQCYKYLGIYVNLDLDFAHHFKIIQSKYQGIVKTICYLKQFNKQQRITLINAVPAALLMYTMNVLIIPSDQLSKMDKWTAQKVKACMKAPNDSSTRLLTQIHKHMQVQIPAPPCTDADTNTQTHKHKHTRTHTHHTPHTTITPEASQKPLHNTKKQKARRYFVC